MTFSGIELESELRSWNRYQEDEKEEEEEENICSQPL